MCKGKCQGFVVGEDAECATFHKVTEVFDSQIHGQQLTIKSAVMGFSWFEPFGEEGKGLPLVINLLLEDRSYCYVGGISDHTGWCVQLGVDKKSGVSQSVLDLYKGCGCCIIPAHVPGTVLGCGE